MQYLIINRLGVFVTRVSPRHIREHIYSLINQREAGLNLSSWDRGNQILYRNQVADFLEKDFVSCTRGIERMKQSLLTMAQPSLLCAQILVILADAVPYSLISSTVPKV